MKISFSLLVCCALLVNSHALLAQKLPVSVNYLTGTANVNIPITSISNGGVSVPVSLNYSATGVKVKDVEGAAGLGWQLSAGGQISRQVRGLPDDYNAGVRAGWLYGSNAAKVDTFTITNTGTCATGMADMSNLLNAFDNLNDTEPDVFYASAPGLSCQIVFDAAHVPHTLGYNDLKIKYDATGGLISAFSIVNDKGTTYRFGAHDEVTRILSAVNPESIKFFRHDYKLYQDSVKYYSTWYLTSVTDANGNTVNLVYQDDALTGNTAQGLYLYLPNSGSTTLRTSQYTVNQYIAGKHLVSISNNASTVQFSYNASGYTNRTFLASILWPGVQCLFDYVALNFHIPGGQYDRYALSSVSLNGAADCENFGKYKFDYIGGPNTPLPDSTSAKIDYWGYYNAGTDTSTLLPKILVNPSNGTYSRYQIATDALSRPDYTVSLDGNTRSANPAVVATAALAHIYYDDNAKTSLEYESNDYYDNSASGVVHGGGIRIKKITDFDGLDSTKNVVRSFSYNNPYTGISSGRPITLPTFAFTVPYSGSGTTAEKWNWSTIRSEDDLSDDDHSILYSYVRETRPGGGSTLYHYSNPATYWDGASGDWSPTVDYFARVYSCFSAGFCANGRYLNPFAPNPNYDFERGMVDTVTNYNGSTKVSQSVYTYVRTASGTPNTVYGLRFTADQDSTYKGYTKYKIYTDVSKLVSVENSTVYDMAAPTQYHQTGTNYYYASPYHKLLTSQVATNSDGTQLASYFKYVKDYTPTASSDSTINALYHMQARNINIPIEQYVQATRGSTVTTTSAAVSRYKLFAMGGDSALVLPATMYSLNNAAGVGSFAVSGISGGTFNIDSRYISKMYNTDYAPNGYPQTAYNNRRQAQTVITDDLYKLPLATFGNAAIGQIGYNNFNGTTSQGAFTQSGTFSTTSTDTRVGLYSLSLQTGTTLSRDLMKAPLATSCVFSAWIKANASGQFTVTMAYSGGSHTYTYAYANPANAWVYVEYRVPLTGIISAYTASIQCNHAILIDDLLFYPGNAEVNTSEYDPVTFFKLAQTNTNGKASYFKYDAIGRVTYALDQDKNILARNTYERPQIVPTELPKPTVFVSPVNSVNTTTVVGFSTLGYGCQPFIGLNYLWDFGDGTTSTATNPVHTFTATGTYNVILTTGASGYASVKSDTTKITVAPAPVTIRLNNYTTGTDTLYIQLKQGGVVKYFFPTAAVNSMTVSPGTYDISVRLNGTHYDPLTGIGYGSVNLTGIATDCQDWFHSNGYTFSSVDLTAGSLLNINIVTDDCP